MIAMALALLLGGLASFALEGLLRPRVAAPWRRPTAALLVHLGSWCLLHAGFLAVLQRPWFASAFILSMQLVVIQTSLIKWRSLKEPFLYQDFDYFLDAIRHPRLYLPFFGLWLAVGAMLAGTVAIAAFLWLEPWLFIQLAPGEGLLAFSLEGLVGVGLLMAGIRRLPPVTLVPSQDLPPLGLYAFLWSYGRQTRRPLDSRLSPPEFRQPATTADLEALPDVVVVQSESFFDPRRWSDHVHPDTLTHWDRLVAGSLAHGPLRVPAWGANTVRTEAAFLTGLGPGKMGIHRFNPYQQLARQPMPNLLASARRLGYRTVALHPWPASFYLRDRVLPSLGIDHFLDISDFDPADRDGQYIGDAALARRVGSLLDDRDNAPLFIFVITMENHGPLHLETPSEADARRLSPAGQAIAHQAHYRDLQVYLRHLANADRMLDALSCRLAEGPRDGLLCWYGDHVPILDQAYQALGEPDGTTDYLIWSTRPDVALRSQPEARDVSRLGVELLGWIHAHAEHSALTPTGNHPLKKNATPSRHTQEQE
ncbi:MAG: LTA synthase family protein [Halomonas sp.]|nr:LTA synthase family protein [Halomonas sp.]